MYVEELRLHSTIITIDHIHLVSIAQKLFVCVTQYYSLKINVFFFFVNKSTKFSLFNWNWYRKQLLLEKFIRFQEKCYIAKINAYVQQQYKVSLYCTKWGFWFEMFIYFFLGEKRKKISSYLFHMSCVC